MEFYLYDLLLGINKMNILRSEHVRIEANGGCKEMARSKLRPLDILCPDVNLINKCCNNRRYKWISFDKNNDLIN